VCRTVPLLLADALKAGKPTNTPHGTPALPPSSPAAARLSNWGTPVLDAGGKRLQRPTRVCNPLFDTLSNGVIESK